MGDPANYTPERVREALVLDLHPELGISCQECKKHQPLGQLFFIVPRDICDHYFRSNEIMLKCLSHLLGMDEQFLSCNDWFDDIIELYRQGQDDEKEQIRKLVSQGTVFNTWSIVKRLSQGGVVNVRRATMMRISPPDEKRSKSVDPMDVQLVATSKSSNEYIFLIGDQKVYRKMDLQTVQELQFIKNPRVFAKHFAKFKFFDRTIPPDKWEEIMENFTSELECGPTNTVTLVDTPGMHGNFLVQKEYIINVDSGKQVSWKKAQYGLDIKGDGIYLPTLGSRRVRHVGENARNKLLAQVWNVYGRRMCLIMVFMFARLISNMTAGIRSGSEAGAWFLHAKSQIYKSSLIKIFCKAVLCEDCVMGPNHTHGSEKAKLTRLVAYFDDPGKNGKDLSGLVNHILSVVNVGRVTVGRKTVSTKTLILASFNDDNYARVMERDDTEGSLRSKCIVVNVDQDREKEATTCIDWNGIKCSVIVPGLCLVQKDDKMHGDFDQFLKGTTINFNDIRQRNLVSHDMMYATQLWESFTKSASIPSCPMEEVKEFVTNYMMITTTDALPMLNLESLQGDASWIYLCTMVQRYHEQFPRVQGREMDKGHLWIPFCWYWDPVKNQVVERLPTQTKAIVKLFKKHKIIIGDKTYRPRVTIEGRKQQNCYHVNCNLLGLDLDF